MHPCRDKLLVSVLLAAIVGCSNNTSQQPNDNIEANVQSSNARDTKVDPPNEFGFAKISFRVGDIYHEGIVDAKGKEVIRPSSALLVNDIADNLALVQMASKFLFVPLDQGFVSSHDLDSVDGFQYAEPYRCGLAMVSVNDARFYINANFEKAFNADFEFAESFHHDRAMVRDDGRYRIIDPRGKTVAELNFDQVTLQSSWCWQVTNIEEEKYLSGFVDLNGELITELIYDYVGNYDPEIKRIPVVRNKRHGFLDEHAKVAIPLKYEYAEVFNRGKARVIVDGRSFFINPDGMEVPEG